MKTLSESTLLERTIGGVPVALTALPSGLVVDETVGLVLGTPEITGQIVHHARPAFGAHALFETRAVITPKGDYLLMFPEGMHYNQIMGKGNELLAYRSKDRGRIWQGPTTPFDIEYSQHGFIPLIPKGGKRLYAFGTQPVPGMYTRERGQCENAPIGYRYSDDDGYHWSEVRIIRPKNDPEYRGMAVMQMCETDSGAWILSTYENDHTYRPVMCRQYILRSDDRGATWTLLPHERHGGWYQPKFNSMGEGRPIHLGNGHVLMLLRTTEGHLWAIRSEDDGRNWSQPEPTPLIHPDAPPMLTLLSDGRTLAAFHHNRHHDNSPDQFIAESAGKADRSEIWVAFSRDGGASWSEPRFVFANALAAEPGMGNFVTHGCSYLDLVVDRGEVHIFFPHRWMRAMHLRIPEAKLRELPTKAQLK